jgi:curved DNA-binding protein CbpA
MNGSLSEGVLPGILKELYVGRRTGVLQLARGDERHGLQFRKGVIVRGETSVQQQQLGETLVRQGVLGADDLERATQVVVREGRRLGVVLQELGLIDKQRMEDGLALQVRGILHAALAWGEGHYVFEERPVQDTLDSEVTLKLPTGELILEAVRLVQDPDVVHYALGDLNRVLGLSSDPLLRFQHVTLSPMDGYILSRIDGTLSAREVIQMIPLPPADAERSLFGLLSTGVVEYLPLPPKPAPPPDARRTAPPPAVVQVRAAEPPAPAAASRQEGAASSALDLRRREILDAFEGLKAKTHFEVLEIPKASNEAQVKDAYFRLARKFHPDTHHDPSLADLRDKIEAIFIRLGEAYEVLRDRNKRSSYESDLASRMPRGPTGSPRDAPAEAVLDPAAESRLAEESIRRAEKCLIEEKYWDAIQLLEPAIPAAAGKWKSRARLGLARAYLKNPLWLKRAEEQLQAIVREDPHNPEAYFLLGTLYKQGGLRSRAVSMLRKALEAKPDHEQAASELAALELPDAASAPEGGGLLKKLFGRS